VVLGSTEFSSKFQYFILDLFKRYRNVKSKNQYPPFYFYYILHDISFLHKEALVAIISIILLTIWFTIFIELLDKFYY